MEITKYELVKESCNISRKMAHTIRPGCVLEQTGDRFDEVIQYFDTEAEALKELKKHNSSINEFSGVGGTWYLVEEYYVRKGVYEFDPDEPDDWENNWISGGDVNDFSKMEIKLVEKPSYDTLAVFDNMADAEMAENDYEGENEVYLSF